MIDWATCAGCGLRHSARADGCCPRCRLPLTAPPGAAPPAAAAVAGIPAAAPARPGGTARTSAVKGLGIAGAAFGLVLSRLLGPALLIPAVATALAAVLLSRVGPRRARPFAGAAGLVLGHAAWMAFGAVAIGSWQPVLLDLVIMGAGVAWLLASPGLAVVISLSLFEAAAVVVNVLQLREVEDGQVGRALSLHLLLRFATVLALAVGYRELRKQARAVPPDVARVFE